MRLVRYNPFNEMTLFKNAFDEFFTDSGYKTSTAWTPAVDIVSNEDTVDLNVEIPGMKKEDITVNIEDRVLTIAGERRVENEEKKENYYRRERRYGSFKRAFTLSDDILTDEITAEYTDGILKVSLKKDTTSEKVKQITVN
ncbi:MAG TPA: molecular chaperone [Desulfobacteraceae bacterium]|nr:molecular chaperone [Desulfobacteraceae bacterium]|tara:strand:+ start:861 stop:1283 length:423 start_codon:yes stop_codon:yes gene_type:complete